MQTTPRSWRYSLRQANSADAWKIRRIIYQVQITPIGLNWRRFILAVDESGNIIGCGQVKAHKDGSLELASIAVLPMWRGRGVARAIIEQLIRQYQGTLYLTCRSSLEPFYLKFNFQTIQFAEMPPYFQQISRLAAFYYRLAHLPGQLLVMRRG